MEYIINEDCLDSATITHADATGNLYELVRCKNCIHRGRYDEKLHCVVYPDEKCPAMCDDPFYSWRPDDDWFCPNGEVKQDEAD